MASSTGTGSISGLGSGYDWASMVKNLRKVEENRLVPYKSQLSKCHDRLSAWKKVSSLLSKLQTSVSGMKELTGDGAFKVGLSSSRSSVPAASLVSVATGDNAVPGQYSIVVNQLAKAEKLQSDESIHPTNLTDSLGKVGVVTINGKELTLDGTESLGTLKTKINSLDAGAVASVLQDSRGIFHLTLTSISTGSTGVTLDDLEGGDALFSTTALQEGQDALFTVDGFSMASSTNTTDMAIPGLEVSFLEADPGVTVDVTVGRDSEDSTKKVQAFVQAYNDLLAYYEGQMTYTPGESSTGGVLFGDTTLKNIKRSFQSIFLGSNLSSMGVTMASDNRLKLDTDVLGTALNRDSGGIRQALASVAMDFHAKLNAYNDDIDGTVTLKGKSIQNNIDRLNDKIVSMATLIDRRMNLLARKYTRVDSALYQFSSMSDYLTNQISLFSKSKN